MWRKVSAIIAALLAINVVVIAGFFIGAYVLGSERVLEPATYEATTLWLVVSSLIGFAAALCGGAACEAVARDGRTARYLAGVIFLLGIVGFFMATPSANDPAPPPRPVEETGFTAIRNAAEHGREPLSTRILNPLLGVAGIWIGALLVARTRSGAATRRE